MKTNEEQTGFFLDANSIMRGVMTQIARQWTLDQKILGSIPSQGKKVKNIFSCLWLAALEPKISNSKNTQYLFVLYT